MTPCCLKRTAAALAFGTAMLAVPAVAAAASATLKDLDGKEVGTVELTQTATDGVLLKVDITNLPPGEHAFHTHETGKCEPPFKSAGGHFNPDDDTHGYMTEDGPHAGDMPNISVPESGKLTFEVYNDEVSVAEDEGLLEDDEGYLFDDDGSAIVVHDGIDDYKSQPSGDAGDRIACGVIEK
ncbi:Superoxide dismutase [Cu-Zn] precursor [Methyloligella halotolerans]|uniref:Superoxide dismutase [Cu-Zn] n=1 Tax=Methyloligella halotolerans TaxID=1177755 RepID=A0A1E2S106_9HYPH|nr:superoxide dismutase family protein [Methyloligella halotolerans]ODA68176.1 Superoxide dismutase [Cu-Zn] precursor [Methyloligella halotolerans]